VWGLLGNPFQSSPAKEERRNRFRLSTWRTNSVLGHDELVLHLRSELSVLNVARQTVIAACTRAGLAPHEMHDFTVAVNEAVTNAVIHGSPDGLKDFVTVRCAITKQAVIVNVIDHGRGYRRQTSESEMSTDALHSSGLGLLIMRRLSDGLKIRSDTHGTTVTMAKFFSYPAKVAH
jgi:stage II sporulation protein AB (anti-sigma F factor)